MKMFKKNISKYNIVYLNIIILLSFILVSILSILLIWYHNKIYFTGDSPFHIARLQELVHTKYVFPKFALNSFNSVGSAVMTMYPYVFLYPMALLFRIIGSIKCTLYITFILGTFTSLIISYYSSLGLTYNKIISYIFALIYSMSYEFINMYFTSSVIGVYWSTIFMPLVIFGFIYYIKYSKWLMLSIGMSLIIFSSIITAMFTTGLLFIWLIVNYKIINKSKLINLIKSILVTVCTTTIIWLPALKLGSFNKFRILNEDNNIQTIGLVHIIYYSIVPKITEPAQSLTIYSLLGVIIGIITFIHFSYIFKQMYLLSIFIILLCTPIFPWSIIRGHFILFKMLQNIQATCRILVFPQVILEFILSYCIVHYICKFKFKSKYHFSVISVVLIILIIIFGQMIGQKESLKATGINKQITNSKLLKNDLPSYDPGYNYDYYPKALTKQDLKDLHKHNVKYHNHIIHFYIHGDGNFSFITKNYIHRLSIPFIYYRNVRYKDVLNHKYVKSYPSKHQLMTITNVYKGNHYIHVDIPLTKIDIISYIFTMFGIIAYFYLFCKNIGLGISNSRKYSSYLINDINRYK